MKRTADPSAERAKIQRAVRATVSAWRTGHGVVVHCHGGTGRTGTVLGCVLRELGVQAAEVIDFLDRVHKVRGKPGWPESSWQRELVEHWKTRSTCALVARRSPRDAGRVSATTSMPRPS